MGKIKAGIIGGAGYTAGELIRILLYHPGAEIVFVHSSSHAGQPVTSVHEDMAGETGLIFTGEPDLGPADVIFLCQGHGKSKEFLRENKIPGNLKIIDLSTDFRIRDNAHQFVYGLPELNRELIRNAKHLANPGCFATGIQLAFLPLAAAGLLTSAIHIFAVTGSTGAGQQPTATTHYSWRENNLSAYKMFEHQHQTEILQTIRQLQPGFKEEFNFIPVRGNFTRGIFVTLYTRFEGNIDDARHLYQAFYQGHPFTLISTVNPGMKQVINTNKALLYPEVHGNNLVVVSCTDNLLKGASGQAVQNMNLMFGLDETTGLKLKGIAF